MKTNSMLTRYHHSVSCPIIVTAVRLKCFDAALFEYQYHFLFQQPNFFPLVLVQVQALDCCCLAASPQ